jgi:hypothetical protein
MTLLVACPPSYPTERAYVLRVVLGEWLGLAYRQQTADRPNVQIRRADDPLGLQLTIADDLFGRPASDWLTGRALPEIPLRARPISAGLESGAAASDHALRDQPLPVLFGAPAVDGRPGQRDEQGISVSVDILGTIFFVLTRYEELVRPDRDRHGRFPASASLAAKAGFLDRPIVDELVDLLWSAIAALWPDLRRRPSQFRLRLTHDVDQPWSALRRRPLAVTRALAADLVRRHDPDLAARRLRSAMDAVRGRVDRDPYNTFDLLMDVSERHGLQSLFYFMAGNRPGDPDFRYRIEDPPLGTLLRRIHDRGHEIGLHASYGSFGSVERMVAETRALIEACAAAGFEQATWGVRQHYLRLEPPTTWVHQETAGLAHDSSLGFADASGFRAGTSKEYPVYDLRARRQLELRERPLLIMDATLLGYLRLAPEAVAARARATVDHCRRHGGDAVVLYHNTTLAPRAMWDHYRNLVAILADP